MQVVDFFSKEQPGQGRGDLATRYTYYVETLKDKRRVYLRGPANLHNGFDFIVCVEDTNFNISGTGNRRKRPSHDDIINDLREKHKKDSAQFEILSNIIESTYRCKEVNADLLTNLDFKAGIQCDLLIKVLKWLFIEQDIRFWNYSGRGMLWEGICSINHS